MVAAAAVEQPARRADVKGMQNKLNWPAWKPAASTAAHSAATVHAAAARTATARGAASATRQHVDLPGDSARLCDASLSDHRGSWQKVGRQQTSERQSYLDTMYNFTAFKQLPRGAAGKVNNFAFCRRDGLHAAYGRYLHASGCRRLSVREAVRRLSSRRLTIVGDSVWMQLWLVMAMVHQQQRLLEAPREAPRLEPPGGRAPRHWPDAATWFCGPEDEQTTDLLLRRLAPPARAAGGDDVMIFSFGIWYNLRNVSCGCDPTMPPSDAYQCRRKSSSLTEVAAVGEAYRPLPAAEVAAEWSTPRHINGLRSNVSYESLCSGPRPHGWVPATADMCYREARANMCLFRQQRTRTGEGITFDGMSQCDLAADLVRLARWVEANRARLPRHVFVADSLSQHFKPNAGGITRQMMADEGRWRNVIARRIWARHAPSVTYLHLEDILIERASSHLDLAHWCIDSVAFEEATSALLTAVLSEVTRRESRG